MCLRVFCLLFMSNHGLSPFLKIITLRKITKSVTIRYKYWGGWCLPARWCTDYLEVSVQCVRDRGCPPNSQCGRPILIARCQHRLQFTFIWLETCICLVGSVAWWLDYQTKSQEFYSVGRLCFSNDFMRHKTSIVSW